VPTLTSEQKLAMVGVVGLGALAIALLAFGGTANASTGTGGPAVDPNSARGQAAIALAAAIQADGGYQGTQAGLVIAYETAVSQATGGLQVDAGYPGQNVMASLRADLTNMGTNASTGTTYASQYPLVYSIATYPWLAAGTAGAIGGGGWEQGNVPAVFVNNSAAWTAGTTVGT
jgi:hypothetical protein